MCSAIPLTVSDNTGVFSVGELHSLLVEVDEVFLVVVREVKGEGEVGFSSSMSAMLVVFLHRMHCVTLCRMPLENRRKRMAFANPCPESPIPCNGIVR